MSLLLLKDIEDIIKIATSDAMSFCSRKVCNNCPMKCVGNPTLFVSSWVCNHLVNMEIIPTHKTNFFKTLFQESFLNSNLDRFILDVYKEYQIYRKEDSIER